MPSPGTLKSLSKALHTHAPTLTVPLPDDLAEALESYLEKHAKYDDSSSERLQEELLSVHEKHVAGHPERLAGFIAVLSQLFPAIRSPSRIFQWWDLLKGDFEDNFLSEKDLVSESFSALSKLLSLDDVQPEDGRDPAVTPFVDRAISMWIEQHQGTSAGKPVDHIEKGTRETLISYGKKHPKDFLTALDTVFARADCRMEAATLLCDFIQAQPPHLYIALETPLFNNLLRCLQLDTSTTVVSLTLTALTMLLPHSPASLASRLPTLFNIYARLLFWHRQLPDSTDLSSEQPKPKPLIDPAGWEACAYSPDLDGNSVSSLRRYFTTLYGLYPINFMDYIRKPYRYLRHANDPSVDVVEVQPSEIRHKSEKFQKCHLLHPNFYHLTIESEKTDHGRWQASEPTEVVVDCAALYIAEDQRGPERAEDDDNVRRQSSLFSKDETNSSIPDFALLRAVPTDDGMNSGQFSRRGSADTRPRSAAGPGDSPTLPSQLAISPSQTQLQDLINSNKAIKSGLNQSLANDSVPSLSLSQHELNAEAAGTSAQPITRSRATSSLSVGDTSSLVSQLQRQVLLLQNDLSFERYLKQQHMVHMGELRRRQVKEAASEAEMQNLVISNRNLKSRFEDAKNTEMQVRKESEKSRSLAKKWEADLSAKLKTLREDNKKTKARVGELEHEVERSRAECDELKSQLCAFEVREQHWTQNTHAQEIDMSEMDRLKSEVTRLTVVERDFQARKADMERAAAALEDAESQIRVLNAKLEVQDQDLQRTVQDYDSQIATLKSRLTERGHAASGERPPSAKHHAVEAALSASRAKQDELQRQYDLLSRKYTALQSSLFDMQCDLSAGAGPPSKPGPAARHDGDDAQAQASSLSSSPTQPRGRLQRMFSSSHAFEAAAGYNATPTLGARSSTSTAGPSEAGTGSSAAAAGADPRSQGRGGVGGKIRKEGKEGKEKEGDKDKDKDKKDRRLGSLRGMRNFHVV